MGILDLGTGTITRSIWRSWFWPVLLCSAPVWMFLYLQIPGTELRSGLNVKDSNGAMGAALLIFLIAGVPFLIGLLWAFYIFANGIRLPKRRANSSGRPDRAEASRAEDVLLGIPPPTETLLDRTLDNVQTANRVLDQTNRSLRRVAMAVVVFFALILTSIVVRQQFEQLQFRMGWKHPPEVVRRGELNDAERLQDEGELFTPMQSTLLRARLYSFQAAHGRDVAIVTFKPAQASSYIKAGDTYRQVFGHRAAYPDATLLALFAGDGRLMVQSGSAVDQASRVESDVLEAASKPLHERSYYLAVLAALDALEGKPNEAAKQETTRAPLPPPVLPQAQTPGR